MIYFPILWLFSILFYILFFVQIRRLEKKQKIFIQKYPGNKFPKIKELNRIIKYSTDKKIAIQIKKALVCLYLSYVLFPIPILIYFIIAIFT